MIDSIIGARTLAAPFEYSKRHCWMLNIPTAFNAFTWKISSGSRLHVAKINSLTIFNMIEAWLYVEILQQYMTTICLSYAKDIWISKKNDTKSYLYSATFDLKLQFVLNASTFIVARWQMKWKWGKWIGGYFANYTPLGITFVAILIWTVWLIRKCNTNSNSVGMMAINKPVFCRIHLSFL